MRHWQPVFIAVIFRFDRFVSLRSCFPPENSREHRYTQHARQFGESEPSVQLTISLMAFSHSLAASQARNTSSLTHSRGISPFWQSYVMLLYGGVIVGCLLQCTGVLETREVCPHLVIEGLVGISKVSMWGDWEEVLFVPPCPSSHTLQSDTQTRIVYALFYFIFIIFTLYFIIVFNV